MRIVQRTKRVLLVVLATIACGALSSCKGPKAIPDEDLVNIFHDAFIANAYVDECHSGADSINLYEPIFERYGYTIEDMRYTMRTFSERKSAMLSDLVTAASERIEEEYRHEKYKVMILDTIDKVAQRTYTRIIYSDTLIQAKKLKDTTKLRIRINDLVPGNYNIRFDYLIDSLDENRNSRVEVYALTSDSSEVLRNTMMLSRHRDSKYSRRLEIDTIHRAIIINMYYHPHNEESKLPDITIRNFEVERVLPIDVSVDSLFNEQLDIRIFNHALMMAFPADTVAQRNNMVENETQDSLALRTN